MQEQLQAQRQNERKETNSAVPPARTFADTCSARLYMHVAETSAALEQLLVMLLGCELLVAREGTSFVAGRALAIADEHRLQLQLATSNKQQCWDNAAAQY